MKLEVFMNGGKSVISLLTFFLEFVYSKMQIPEIVKRTVHRSPAEQL